MSDSCPPEIQRIHKFDGSVTHVYLLWRQSFSDQHDPYPLIMVRLCEPVEGQIFFPLSKADMVLRGLYQCMALAAKHGASFHGVDFFPRLCNQSDMGGWFSNPSGVGYHWCIGAQAGGQMEIVLAEEDEIDPNKMRITFMDGETTMEFPGMVFLGPIPHPRTPPPEGMAYRK